MKIEAKITNPELIEVDVTITANLRDLRFIYNEINAKTWPSQTFKSLLSDIIDKSEKTLASDVIRET